MSSPTLIVQGTYGGGAYSVTSSTLNTTGSTLIVLDAGIYTGHSNAFTLSDSYGNTWNSLTARTGGLTSSQFFYCLSPVCGTGHTFTVNGGSNQIYPTISVSAWGGTNFAYESDTGAGETSGTSLQTGSLTPAENGCLVVSATCNFGSSLSIDSGMTAATINTISGVNCSAGIAYLVQSSAAAINPKWSWTTGSSAAAALAVFKPVQTVTTYDYTNAAVTILAKQSTATDHGIGGTGTATSLAFSGSNSGAVCATVTGAKIEILIAHAGTSSSTDTTNFIIDGTAVSVTIPSGSASYYQQDYVTLYNGTDTTHTVECHWNRLGTTGLLRITGGAPAIAASFTPYGSSGFTSTDLQTSGSPSYYTFALGSYGAVAANQAVGQWVRNGQSIRLHAKGGKIAVYGAYAPSHYSVWKDGAQVTTNASAAVSVGGSGSFPVSVFDLGTPDTNYHVFEIVLTDASVLVQDLAYEAGNVDTSWSAAVRPLAVIGGDSIRAGSSNGSTPVNDVTQNFPWLALRAMGYDIYSFAAGGTTISGWGTPGLPAVITQLQNNSAIPAFGEAAWGVNDSNYPVLGSTGLYTSTSPGTVTGRVIGAQYPGSGDAALISTFQTALATYLADWFTAFPNSPLFISKMFRGSPNDWLRNYWVTSVVQPTVTTFSSGTPGATIVIENTDNWYQGGDGLHPQISTGCVAGVVPFALQTWATASMPLAKQVASGVTYGMPQLTATGTKPAGSGGMGLNAGMSN